MKKKQILHAALLACSCSSLIGSSLFLGDLTAPDGNNNGFSFDLLPKLGKNRSQETIYVGSAVDLTNSTDDIKKFALAAASSSGTGCRAIAQEKATINGTPDQSNPLYGAQLSTLCMAGTKPVVITQEDHSTVYMITSAHTSSTCAIVSNNMVKAADETDGLFSTAIPQDTICGADPLVFATIIADDPDQGGIGVFKTTSSGLIQQAAVKDDANIKAVLVSKDSEVFKINSALNSLDREKINLYWSDKLFRLFIGVQAQNGAGAEDGCRSIGVGYLQVNGDNTALTLYPIAPDVAITGETKIIGAQGQDLAAYAYKQTIMFTSTGLTYLILVGDSDDSQNNDNSQRMCFALPLVDESVNPSLAIAWKTSTTHATLAKKDSLPTSFYKTNPNNVSVMTGRGFQTPATVAIDLYDRSDAQVVVGRVDLTAMIPGIIVDLDVYNDTVFVALNADEAQYSGVFYSQAIFDENGVIANWTRWQRFTFTTDKTNDCMYVPTKGGVFQFETRNNEPRSVNLSQWSKGDKDGLSGGTLTNETVGLVDLLTTEFPPEKGGVFGLFDFHNDFAPTFFNQTLQAAMMLVTGYKKIGLFLTRSSENTDDFAVTGDYKNHTLYYNDGTIHPAPDDLTHPKALFVSGGALDDIEAITSATIIIDNANDKRFIVVGGMNGLAVLRNNVNHLGIDDSISAWFDGLKPDTDNHLVFETIGNFRNIKKLWTSVLEADQWLFILTLDGLYRISAAELSQEEPTATALITLDTVTPLNLSVHDFFTDVVVSHAVCLLGTNKGLLRNGNDTVIFEATSDADCNWTKVDLLKPYQHVAQIIPLLTSNTPYEFATQGDGQVYVLTHSNELTTSALHCFAIKSIALNGATINDATCLPLYRETIQSIYAPYMTFGSLRNSFATNGALTVTTSPKENNKNLQMLAAPVNNLRMIRAIENYPFTEIKLSLSNTDEIIRGFVYNTALGSWIAYGNFGIRVCE